MTKMRISGGAARIIRMILAGAMGATLLLLGACATPVAFTRDEVVEIGRTPSGLQPGDKVQVIVFGEDKLSGTYEIDPDGYISLPLAGTVKAKGLTKVALEHVLARKFQGDYLKDPKVTVDVVAYRTFFTLGEVERVGEYPWKPGLNVVTALSVSGGPTFRASDRRVLIKRSNEPDFREYPLSALIPILPGDVLRVPERYF